LPVQERDRRRSRIHFGNFRIKREGELRLGPRAVEIARWRQSIDLAIPAAHHVDIGKPNPPAFLRACVSLR